MPECIPDKLDDRFVFQEVTTMHILLAEDEPAMAEAVVAFLRYHQYTVDWVDNGLDAWEQAMRGAYDGLVLDIMMPGLDGLQVLSRLRCAGKTMPILLLTARGELEDKIAGFEQGADDYLPKPFALPELLARVKAMLRRRENYHPDLTAFADVTLDQSGCMRSAQGRSCSLSRREYQLMEFLMNHPGAYFSADALLDRVWGMDVVADQGTVWVHISYLRKKLLTLGASAVIRSKRGIGYALEKKS